MTVVSQRGVVGGWVVGIGVRGFRDAHVKERNLFQDHYCDRKNKFVMFSFGFKIS